MDAKWDARMLELADRIAMWSKDPSTIVGAVIADDYHRVLGVGYNGLPRGVEDTETRYNNRAIKYKMIVHAEANAILNSAKGGRSIYTTIPPCSTCAGLIIQSGLKRVVSHVPSAEQLTRWGDDMSIALAMFAEADVKAELL